MTLTFIHARLGTTLVIFSLALGLWGLYRYWRGQGVSSDYLGALVIGELLVLAIGGLGGYLAVGGGAPARWIHILYGVTAVAAWPAAYVYLQGGRDRRAMFIYSLVSLFVFGLALRAIGTA